MTNRDRLIKLIHKGNIEFINSTARGYHEHLADYLLENGIIVPTFEIGTKVYVITSQTSNGKNLYIFEDIITHYVVCDNYTLMCFENHIAEANHNWDKIFLTKEEAEEKLKELNDNG